MSPAHRWVARACTGALVVLIAVMSASPLLKNTFHTHGVLHPWLHLLVFALVSASAIFCSERSSTRAVLLACLLVFGWGTEYREHVVNGMPIEQLDVLHDAMGVVLGGAAGLLVSSRLTADSLTR